MVNKKVNITVFAILTVVLVLTTIVTIVNVLKLRKGFAKKEQEQKELIGLKQSPNDEEDEEEEDDEDKRIVKRWYYIFTFFPLLVAAVSTYAAKFPGQGVWIIPILNLIGGLAFLSFIRMMVVGCNETHLRTILTFKEDECDPTCQKFICCKCCVRENQWRGLEFRTKMCALILLTPVYGYLDAFLTMYVGMWKGSPFEILLTIFTIICMIVPIQMLRLIQGQIEQYCRISGTETKAKFMGMMVPILQLQGLAISILMMTDVISSLGDLKASQGATRLQGLLTCFEMFIVSILWNRKFYTVHDLDAWQDRTKEV